MIKYIQTSIVPLTPDLAMDFATMASHRGERPKLDGRIEYLKGKLHRGLFHPPKWARAHLGGKIYRVNGQHSSAMLAEANGHFPHDMKVVIDDYACDSDEDMAELFAQFDQRESLRTDTDSIMAVARNHRELDDLKPTAIKNAIAAVTAALVMRGMIVNRVTTQARRALIHDNIAFILWVRQFIGSARMKIIGVLGATFDTYDKNPAEATTFWTLVRDESHPENDHPTRVLGRFLCLLEAGKEFNRKTGKKWTPRAIFAKCIHAWNAYRTQTTTTLSYYEDSPLPEARK